MCKNPRNLAGNGRKRKRETHDGGILRNGGGGAHFDLQISAAMIPCWLKLIKIIEFTRFFLKESKRKIVCYYSYIVEFERLNIVEDKSWRRSRNIIRRKSAEIRHGFGL